MSRLNVVGVGFLLAFNAGSAFANPDADASTDWYMGVDVGSVAAIDGCLSGAVHCDDSSVGFSLFGGYQVNDWLSAEGGYRSLGEFSADYQNATIESNEVKYQGLWGAAKAHWSLNDNSRVFAKVGAMAWEAKASGPRLSESDKGLSPILGFGGEYLLSPNWSVTLEYQWINDVGDESTGGTDIGLVNLGALYRFTTF